MRHFGLIGRTLGHSFSAKFFNGKFKAEQIDASYDLFEIDSIDMLSKLVEEQSLDGFNVTIPYKESIIPHLDELSEEAQSIGAVNCVVVRDGKMVGHNTDTTGIEASLHWLDIAPEAKVLILGTGGASKALQWVLRKYDIAFTVVSRDEKRGNTTYSKLTEEDVAQHNIIINTTPLGMMPDVDSAPEIPYSAIGAEHKAFDLVYNPAETLFLKRCKEQGAMTMGGIMMLQTQAIASWHLWK